MSDNCRLSMEGWVILTLNDWSGMHISAWNCRLHHLARHNSF